VSYNPFLVETGQGIPEANAYETVQYAIDYHGSRGNSYWLTLTVTQQQQCIVRASQYLDIRFGPRFRGRKLTFQQGMEWPRANAFSNSRWLYANQDAVPRALRKACAEYAIRAAVLQQLAPDPPMIVNPQDLSQNPPTGGGQESLTAGVVLENLEKVDTLEQREKFMSPVDLVKATQGAGKSLMSTTVADFWIPEYPLADMWLEQLIRNESRRLVRG